MTAEVKVTLKSISDEIKVSDKLVVFVLSFILIVQFFPLEH